MNCSMYLRQVGTLSTYCFLMCYVPMVINALVEYQFITLISITKERFSLLNKELGKIGTNTINKWKNTNQIHPITKIVNHTSTNIKNIRRTHALLCNAGYEINKAYSLQILLNTAHIFINFTTLGYYCFDGAMRLYLQEEDSNMYNTVTTGIWTLCKILQLLNITLTCSMIKKEVALSGEVVFKINDRFKTDIAFEINALVKQIFHWNFKLTAFHLFDLDMELFYCAISASTTYLMILLQLDIANKQSDQIEKIDGNFTNTIY
nr:gustatory receptor for bitter taste 66a-like [Onthophagus taurus]